MCQIIKTTTIFENRQFYYFRFGLRICKIYIKISSRFDPTAILNYLINLMVRIDLYLYLDFQYMVISVIESMTYKTIFVLKLSIFFFKLSKTITQIVRIRILSRKKTHICKFKIDVLIFSLQSNNDYAICFQSCIKL